MRLAAAMVMLLSCLVPAGRAVGQGGDNGLPPDTELWDPSKALGQDKWIPGARRADSLPEGLKGKAAAFPIGNPRDDLTGLVYVPSYADSARTWPVLVEGVAPGHLPLALRDFAPQAEKHGFILLAVEYLYDKGEDAGTSKAWSRDGEVTISHRSRTVPEYLRDMAADERVLRGLLRDLGRAYRVEKRTVAVTGFLGAGVMAYRLPMVYPDLFCAGVSRSGGFSQMFLPSPTAKARNRAFYVIFGDKEEPQTLDNSQQAVMYLNSRRFTKVVAERIPNSGVDSRPEIAANYFRAAIDQLLGDERAAFDRAANIAGLLLEGRLTDGVRTSADRPVDAQGAAAMLESFIDKYPKSEFGGLARLLLARVLVEQLDNRKKAAHVLREFDKLPLSADPAAPDALLYLVEKVMDTCAEASEARRILNRLVARRDIAPQQRTRAARLLTDLDAGAGGAGGAAR